MKNEIEKVKSEILNINDDKLTHKLRLEQMIRDTLQGTNGKSDKRLIMLLKNMISSD